MVAAATPARRVMWWIVTGFVIGLVASASDRTRGEQGGDSQLPRLRDGRPNLTAPAPRTADGRPNLSGVWRSVTDRYRRDLAVDGIQVPLHPAAAAVVKERRSGKGSDDPSTRCLPRGVPAAMLVRDYPWKIVQTRGLVVMLFDESLHFRQIFTDGRGFPDDPAPTWLGYSIGRWEADTLITESTGFVEDTWLDEIGHPHSGALHVTERFRRRTVGSLDVEITIDDAKTYAKPWTVSTRFELLPDADLPEHVCAVGG